MKNNNNTYNQCRPGHGRLAANANLHYLPLKPQISKLKSRDVIT